MYSVIGLLYIFIIVTVGLFVCKNKLVVNYNKVLIPIIKLLKQSDYACDSYSLKNIKHMLYLRDSFANQLTFMDQINFIRI